MQFHKEAYFSRQDGYMRSFYTFLVYLAYCYLWIARLFSKRLRQFLSGRQSVYDTLRSELQPGDKSIWFHCASLGEFEQGVPILERINELYPNHKIVLSFFSPSGYEVKKNTPLADVVVYLPKDTPATAKKFIDAVNPSLVCFVKYEFWPNYLFELQKRSIRAVLISGLFRKEQVFFKWYGGFMRKALKTMDHFFVQDSKSVELLNSLGIENVTRAGDTRFDRVARQIEYDNSIEILGKFKGDASCVVMGSTWPEDEAVFMDAINNSSADLKFVIAPHKIEESRIADTLGALTKKTIRYTEIQQRASETDAQVLIMDTIGLLSKVYSYADIAYVGGAMGTTGLHNILEPATFGVPIIIGQHYEKFPEARKLRKLAGLFSVENAAEFSELLQKLITDKQLRNKTGMISEHFINSNTGATEKILAYLKGLNLK